MEGAIYIGYTHSWIPPIDLKEQYNTQTTYVIPKCIKGYNNYDVDTRKDVYIRLYNPDNINYNENLGIFEINGTHNREIILSNQNASIIFDKPGVWLLEYGLTEYVPDTFIGVERQPFMHFFLTIENIEKYTLFDYIERIRNVVPLETKRYHSQTRLFDISPRLEERFKSIEMPQIFITQMTLRQTLNTLFKFINAIMRLEYVKDNVDTLEIDEFNKGYRYFSNWRHCRF